VQVPLKDKSNYIIAGKSPIDNLNLVHFMIILQAPADIADERTDLD
jgi:hypothetical protein